MKLKESNYLRLYSDIHLDFDVASKKATFDMLWFPEQLDTDKETTLILPGDLWHAGKALSYCGKSWLSVLAQRFQYVLVVLGNHDFWHGNISLEYTKFQNKITEQNIQNVFLLQNSTIEIGNNKFIGATLWTDFCNRDTYCMENAMNVMNDYKYIKYGDNYSKLKPLFILREHLKSKEYIFKNAKKDFPEQKLYVITHHLPSDNSLGEHKETGTTYENALYCSNLDDLIKDSEIDYWFHGHSHHAQNYLLGNTNVISNPKGYPKEDSQYNPWYVQELTKKKNTHKI